MLKLKRNKSFSSEIRQRKHIFSPYKVFAEQNILAVEKFHLLIIYFNWLLSIFLILQLSSHILINKILSAMIYILQLRQIITNIDVCNYFII